MAVENYHLKWDSHVSYLNSSVATLYKNEKFADVVLYSSGSSSSNGNSNSNAIDNAIPTVGISAHKFILSSCSQFFATLFDNTPIPASNGVLYVVLPPELSHRAIQILVQYIYTGEATVSNDILNEVLRGGEILKIRGLCRTASQRESTNSAMTNSNGGNSVCSNSIHYGTNGTRPQHILPSTVISSAALTTDLYTNSKCSGQGNISMGLNGGCTSRYAIDQLSHPQSSIHSQIRGLGASVMPKDSPVIVKSPKLSQMGQLTSSRDNKPHHGSGISVNKEVAIDPDENCCYQAAVVPNILQHESMQLSLPPPAPQQQPQPPPPPPAPVPAPPQSLVSMSSGGGGGGGSGGGGSSLCNDVGCKNCSFNTSADPEKHRQRQRHLSQSEELPHRLPGIERLERDYSDERCEPTDVQISYSRRSRNTNERVPNYFVTDHYDPTSHAQAHLIATVKTPKQYESSVATSTNNATVNSNLHSPPLYPHNFLTIKQEPIDWTTPQTTSMENTDDMMNRPSLVTSPQSTHGASSPKQPLDFKIPVGNPTAVKVEVGASSHSADEDEQLTIGSAIGGPVDRYGDFSRLVCDICKKSFNEPKLWVQHLETHTPATSTTTGPGSGSGSGPGAAIPSTTTTTQMPMGATNNAGSINDGNGSDTLNKSYVPKKRRRVSQQENNMMDHVTLLCDLCNTSFDTPAEWVRHMNNQHTEIELAMFNSKKDKEQKSTNTSTINCSPGSRNHHNHNHHHHHQHHHQQQQQQQQQHQQHSQHHQKHQQTIKKYSNRGGMPSTHSRSESNSSSLLQSRNCGLVNESGSSKIIRSSSPTSLDQQQRISVMQSGQLSSNSLSPSPPLPPLALPTQQ